MRTQMGCLAAMAGLALATAPTAWAADTSPPTVQLTAPANGATVKGTVTVAASAQDNRGVNRVTFRVDGVAKTSDYTAPYTFVWNTASYADGQHVVSARAADNAGNTSRLPDPQVTVMVANTATPPADADGDGVPDASDLCPGTPAGTTVDSTGCPVATPPPTDRIAFDQTVPGTVGSPDPQFPRSTSYCASHILLDPWEPSSRGNTPYLIARDDLPTMGWNDGDPRFADWQSEHAWLARRAQIDDHYSNGASDHSLTTTEAFSFAACRWGIREDLLRAVAVQESDWQETSVGDTCAAPNTVSTGHGSFGIMQMKNLNCSDQGDWGGWSRSANSIPFAVDMYGAQFRNCLEDGISWYRIPAGDSDATRERGCIGAWFSGSYSPSSSYTNSVYQHLANRDWTSY